MNSFGRRHVYINIKDRNHTWQEMFYTALRTLHVMNKDHTLYYPPLTDDIKELVGLNYFFTIPEFEASISETKWAFLITYITYDFINDYGYINQRTYQTFDRLFISWLVLNNKAHEIWIYKNGTIRCQ